LKKKERGERKNNGNRILRSEPWQPALRFGERERGERKSEKREI
jgi:hypothetical protein